MREKIQPLSGIQSFIDKKKAQGHTIVHCHGVFDLLHPGHIRHLQEAKNQGSFLIVSVTPDRFVNKGPNRPLFYEQLRLEQLASLVFVDCVVLNDAPDSVSLLKKIKPHVYVKGSEYKEHSKDVTGKISEESKAVLENGGRLHYTEDVVFSSTHLINHFFDKDQLRIAPFIEKIKGQYSSEDIVQKIDNLSNLKVLVLGDAIIDEYQYVRPLGQSGKGVHFCAELLEKEIFLGGSLIIANHVAAFAKELTLVTAIGKNCPTRTFVEEKLDPKVQKKFFFTSAESTLVKKRYVLKEGEVLTKLFETYSSNSHFLDAKQVGEIATFLKEHAAAYDLILVSDFGNGFINQTLIETLCELPVFLALNTQTNSGNRGFNLVTNYKRANFVSLNEPELRLAAQDRSSTLFSVAQNVSKRLSCESFCVTRGVEGVSVFSNETLAEVPALTMRAVDRVGAGDCFFALSALCAAKKYPPLISAFVGTLAAALDVQIIGNKEAIRKVDLCKYAQRVMK